MAVPMRMPTCCLYTLLPMSRSAGEESLEYGGVVSNIIFIEVKTHQRQKITYYILDDDDRTEMHKR